MRARNINSVKLPAGWADRAAKAAEKVAAGGDPNKSASVWQELKDELGQLSFYKCWYCECMQERSDNAVDHFRPKSKYAFIAFAKENFRYACGFCNSKHVDPLTGNTVGKGNEFPLQDPGIHATDVKGLIHEKPVLLDPCVPNDCALLDFRLDGFAVPSYPDDPVKSGRAQQTIVVYGLNHSRLTDVRQAFGMKLESLINAAQSAYDYMEDYQPLLQQFVVHALALAESISDRSELSAYARKVLRMHRDKVWVRELLESA